MTTSYYYYHWILSFTVGLWDFPGLSLETENLITPNTANRGFNDMYMSLGGLDVSCLPWDFIEPFRTSWLYNWKSLNKVHGHFPHFCYFCPSFCSTCSVLLIGGRARTSSVVKCVDSWTNSNEIVAYYSGMQCQRNWFFSAFYLWLVGTPASPSLLLIGAGRSININNVSLLCSRFKEVSFLASVWHGVWYNSNHRGFNHRHSLSANQIGLLSWQLGLYLYSGLI